jgi:hypothetical protein
MLKLTPHVRFSKVTAMHAVAWRAFVFTSLTGLVRPEARCG